jgi:uncharacterized protein YecT (DUF1311 family)
MKNTISGLLMAMLSLTAFSAHADGACDRLHSEYDKTYCLSKLFLQSDVELNQVYDDLGKTIKPGVKQRLKETEASWIQFRDASCSSGGTIDVDCNFRVNRDRAEYLRDRLRECKAGSCRNEEIVKPSWN